MTFEPEQIQQLFTTVWETVLNLPVDAGADPGAPISRSIAACIHIAGAWNGAVLLECPAPLASKAAAAMFGMDEPALTVVEMQDAIAELVNMLGGHIKSLLPETCLLSLPAVVEGSDYSARVPNTRIAGRYLFGCIGQSVAITILEKNPGKSIAA